MLYVRGACVARVSRVPRVRRVRLVCVACGARVLRVRYIAPRAFARTPRVRVSRETRLSWKYDSATPGSVGCLTSDRCFGKVVHVARKIEELDATAVSSSLDGDPWFSRGAEPRSGGGAKLGRRGDVGGGDAVEGRDDACHEEAVDRRSDHSAHRDGAFAPGAGGGSRDAPGMDLAGDAGSLL